MALKATAGGLTLQLVRIPGSRHGTLAPALAPPPHLQPSLPARVSSFSIFVSTKAECQRSSPISMCSHLARYAAASACTDYGVATLINQYWWEGRTSTVPLLQVAGGGRGWQQTNCLSRLVGCTSYSVRVTLLGIDKRR